MPQTPVKYDAIVLGAGAAGLFCAGLAGQKGLRVLVADHAERPGKKILISGGGRCNFTNIDSRPDRFLSGNRHFAKSALSRYTPRDFLALVEAYGIAWHEKTLGQLFCDGSARQIVDMLLAECRKGEVRLQLGQPVRDLGHSGGDFLVRFDTLTASAAKLVVATGGPSIPKMGATGFAYDLARQFGIAVIPPRPALVPLTLGEDRETFGRLTGLSADVVARCGEARFREAALFTHRGLSGPAILQVSSYWMPGDEIAVDFLPGTDSGWLAQAKRERPRAGLAAALTTRLPARLAGLLAERLAADFDATGELGNRSDKILASIEARLADWRFRPNGTEGFAKAEVTAGGIDTAALSSRTMAATAVPGLYFIGEAVDVTGWLGGYNFQWAWSSAHACALDL